jgi:hypothetical protein
MGRRLVAWWFLAEALVERVTSPPAGGRASDADAYDAICASHLFLFAQAVSAALQRSWDDSYVRRALDSVIHVATDRALDGRIRQAGVCLAVSALTVLLLGTAESKAGPLRWVLPLAVCAIAVTVAIAADPIARAWESKRRR